MQRHQLSILGLLGLSTSALAHPGHAGPEGLLHYLLAPAHAAGLGLLAILLVGGLLLVAKTWGRRRR